MGYSFSSLLLHDLMWTLLRVPAELFCAWKDLFEVSMLTYFWIHLYMTFRSTKAGRPMARPLRDTLVDRFAWLGHQGSYEITQNRMVRPVPQGLRARYSRGLIIIPPHWRCSTHNSMTASCSSTGLGHGQLRAFIWRPTNFLRTRVLINWTKL